MKLKFLGTGTSQGIPVIGSHHPVSLSNNPKDKRLRSSVLITTDSEKKILIDCGPDFRQQMLINKEESIDSVLLTHEHNDHVIGLDDLRPLIFKNGKDMPIYAMKRVIAEVEKRFPYAFSEIKYPGAPSFELNEIKPDENFQLFDIEVQPIDVLHGNLPILGFRINNLTYITDASSINQVAKENLKNLDVLIINVLRKDDPHPSHYILPEVLDLLEELNPRKTYFTHISQQLGFHNVVESELPENVYLAFDGLEIEF